MDYVIVGGDERFAWMARLLRARGVAAESILRDEGSDERMRDIEMLREAKNIVVNYQPKMKGECMSYEALLEKAPSRARVFVCGPGHPPKQPRVIDLWEDEALLEDNARLTAEGALVSAMRAASCALCDMRCMVIGWGRIGRALTEMLVALGARVTVVSRSEVNRNRAVERGAEGVAAEKVAAMLPGHRLVFNTAPAMTLDSTALRRADRDAMFIELASPPYGIDLHAAWNAGLRAWREPALPGRYCPESAARVLIDAMMRHVERGGEHE